MVKEHEAILRQGVDVWNKWREDNPNVRPNLNSAHLGRANLSEADLSGAMFIVTDFGGANLKDANLSEAYFDRAFLAGANLSGANLSGAYLNRVQLSGIEDYISNHPSYANLNRANLTGANLSGLDLTNINFSNANLSGADLSRTILIGTNLEHANISNCRIFGISAWKLNIENLQQSNLIITEKDEPEITVDNLEIAQFVYLLLNNAKLRSVIDTLTTKSVLILGRFTPERKVVLDSIREELRHKGYVPMLFDFDKPANRDLTETVMTLASLARFVIADLSDPNSIPHELMSFAEKLLSVPVQAIFTSTDPHPQPYPMYEHIRRYPHVLPLYRYNSPEQLIASLADKVIKPAEDKVVEMRPPQNPVL